MPAPKTSRRASQTDYKAGLNAAIGALETKTGFKVTDSHKVIGEDETFRQWCDRLAADGLKVDGKPFTLADRPAMAWLYDQIPSTKEQAFRKTLVLMKCAQVGFTVMEMLATIYLGVKFGPCTIGMFLPDMNLAGIKSSERFMPIVRSVPSVHGLMTQEASDGSGQKSGEGNVTRRRIGGSLFIFSWTSGRATTESVPMDFLSFDEVQEMTKGQLEKTMERLSASQFKYTLMGSTANWPDEDIHFFYKMGKQYHFLTECPTCGARKALDDYFPDCIRWDAEAKAALTNIPGAYRYVCENGHWIDDPQHGKWVAQNPEAWIDSAHFPQFLSPTISPDEIMSKFVSSTDKKNFHNRVLGKPYLDPTQIPVTLEHMARCVEAGRAAGVRWKKRAAGAFMGIDQMGAFNVVVIKERLPDGRQAVIHLEEIYSDDPFARCSELMADYGIAACVVEINPNFNDAQRFAKRHEGRVFLCDGFAALQDEMVRWGDAPKLDPSERRTDDETRTRYTVKADQFKTMQVSLARFTAKEPLCLWPDPQELVQEVVEKGGREFLPLAPRAFFHFTRTALVVEKAPDEGGSVGGKKKSGGGANAGTNKYRRVVRKVGIDPHYSYSNQLCDVAWSRAHGTATFLIPQEESKTVQKEKAEAMNMHGLPSGVVGMMAPLPAGEVCGRCSAFPFGDDSLPVSGMCGERNIIVQARDPGCPFFVGRE